MSRLLVLIPMRTPEPGHQERDRAVVCGCGNLTLRVHARCDQCGHRTCPHCV